MLYNSLGYANGFISFLPLTREKIKNTKPLLHNRKRLTLTAWKQNNPFNNRFSTVSTTVFRLFAYLFYDKVLLCRPGYSRTG